ncbi:MAG TPA: TIGR01459 family HAD-type hydrolase [Phenylobacterium sp.]
MTAPRRIAGLSEIADRYDVLLCDVWGVIHNGQASFPDACAALARYKAERGPVILISNAPRPASAVRPQLTQLAVPDAAWTDFVTSGDATRKLLAERAPGPAWKIGPERDFPLYEGLGLDFAAPDDSTFISCTGPFDDEAETPEDYRSSFQVAVDRRLTMICANPDIVVQRGDKLIYCGGALAQLYEQMGGEVIMAGKPFAPLYDLCLARAEQALGRPVDRARVLCIGDGIVTDVRGGNRQGLNVLFVAGGIHGAEAVGPNGLDPAAVETLLGKEQAHAAYALAELVW